MKKGATSTNAVKRAISREADPFLFVVVAPGLVVWKTKVCQATRVQITSYDSRRDTAQPSANWH